MKKEKKEITSKQIRLYGSTYKRLKKIAFDAEITIAEAVDLLSKTGSVSKEKPAAEVKSTGVLAEVSKNIVVVKTSKSKKPVEFFKDREGLYVWDNFKERILASASPTKLGKSFKLNSFQLTRDALDREIEGDLPKSHLFSETDVCAIVAELISKQPGGKDGLLLSNGRANLFYTKNCVVSVYWNSGGRRWSVNTWRRGGLRWYAGMRVFSPAI